MNYRLIESNGIKIWVQLVFNEETQKIEYKPIDGKIELDPQKFWAGDEVAVNSVPPPNPENCMPMEELLKILEEEAKKQPPKKFGPWVYYCKHSPGQAVEAILESDTHFAEWVSPHLTVYYAMDDRKKIVGFRIENLLALKTKMES